VRIKSVGTFLNKERMAIVEVEQGTFRVPMTLKVVPPTPRQGVPVSVEVVRAMSHRSVVSEVAPRTAVLFIGGVEGHLQWLDKFGGSVWPIGKGDLLVAP
jgi:hypothetical protein